MDLNNTNITVWGDSILKGVILDEQDGKYKVLKNSSITSFAEITGCSVKNNAHFGMTCPKALSKIISSFDRRSQKNSEIVILEFGGNDCDFNWSEIANDPNGQHIPKTPISVFKNTMQNMIDTFKNKGTTPILMNLPPLEPERYFDWISRGLNKENILSWLGDKSRIYRWQEAYSNAIEWIARTNNCKLIDVRENFLMTKNYSSQFCVDGIHPNEKGHKKILESLLEFNF